MFSKTPPWASTVLDCKSKMNPDESETMRRKKYIQHGPKLTYNPPRKMEGPILAAFLP